MKKSTITIIAGLLIFVFSCTKNSYQLEAPIPVQDVNIIIQATDTQNVYRFINAQIGKTAVARWDLGNGVTSTGDTAYGRYPFAGTYTVTLTIFNGITAVVDSVDVSFSKDNLSLDSVYACLTGGPDSTNGKTWVMDTSRTNADGTPAFPVEISNTGSNTWKNYSGTGLYNSTWTFWLSGNKLIYDCKGYALCNSARLTEIDSLWGTFNQTATIGGDPYGTYMPKYTPQSWTMSIRNGMHYIQFQGGAFILFYRGCAEGIEYQIDSISSNEMVLTHFETSPAARASAGWNDTYYLVRKGFVR